MGNFIKHKRTRKDFYVATIFTKVPIEKEVDTTQIYPDDSPVTPVVDKNTRHLICDDAHTNRLVLKKYLTLFGCEVDEAENGQHAIQKIQENGQYVIVWMDIKMPKMNGQECTYYLRNKFNYQGVIIGLTGYVDDVTIKKCLQLGMNHVVAKPFNKDIIQMYIDQYTSST